jgi:hypothetical protein
MLDSIVQVLPGRMRFVPSVRVLFLLNRTARDSKETFFGFS